MSERVPLLEGEQGLSAMSGATEILKRSNRKQTKKRNACLNVFFFKLHDDISRIFEMAPRKKRWIVHLVFGILNIFSLGLFGALYWLLRSTLLKESTRDEEIGYQSQFDSDHYIEPEPKPLRASESDPYNKRNTISLDAAIIGDNIYKPLSQIEMVKESIGRTPQQIQKSMIDMNTFLFSGINSKVDENHREYKQFRTYLHQWNTNFRLYSKFIRDFVRSFEFQREQFEEVRKAYKGEYNGLIKDIETLMAIDRTTQELMFTDDVLYKGTGRTSTTKNVDKMKLLNLFQEQLDDTYDRIIECCPVPDKYLQGLPDKARDVCNYEQYFKAWDKAHHDTVAFLRHLKIDAKDMKEQKKLTDMINQLEQIQAIWIEKKGKSAKTSPKLRTLIRILHGLKSEKPGASSRLALARKTAKDDVCNMIRVWYTELVIGRVALLKRSLHVEQPKSNIPVAKPRTQSQYNQLQESDEDDFQEDQYAD